MITLCLYLIAIAILLVVYTYAFAIDIFFLFYFHWWFWLITRKNTFFFPCCKFLNKIWVEKEPKKKPIVISKELPKEKTTRNVEIIRLEPIKPLTCQCCGAPLNNEICEYCGTQYKMIRKYS